MEEKTKKFFKGLAKIANTHNVNRNKSYKSTLLRLNNFSINEINLIISGDEKPEFNRGTIKPKYKIKPEPSKYIIVK